MYKKKKVKCVFFIQVYVESLWEGVDFSTTLSRARFDGLAAGTMAAFVQLAKDVVQRCGLTEAQINKVKLHTTRSVQVIYLMWNPSASQ